MDPDYELVLSIKAVARELDRLANEAMRPLGITAPQADALHVIAQAGPLSLKELGDLLIAEAGHPSRLVDRLVEAGLVERTPAPDDRRRVVLSLTPAGRKMDEKVVRARRQIHEVGRALLGDRDVGPALELFRDLLGGTHYADVIARRRDHE